MLAYKSIYMLIYNLTCVIKSKVKRWWITTENMQTRVYISLNRCQMRKSTQIPKGKQCISATRKWLWMCGCVKLEKKKANRTRCKIATHTKKILHTYTHASRRTLIPLCCICECKWKPMDMAMCVALYIYMCVCLVVVVVGILYELMTHFAHLSKFSPYIIWLHDKANTKINRQKHRIKNWCSD